MASFFDSIKNSIYQRNFRKNTSEVQRRLLHFDACKSIGILFDATEGDSRYLVATYAKKLQKAGKKITLLAYVESDQIPGELMEFAATYFQDMEFSVFGKKDVNWAKVPQGQSIDNFINTSFDWLLALHTNRHAPLEYVSNASKALARVGFYAQDSEALYEVSIISEDNLQKYIDALHSTLKH